MQIAALVRDAGRDDEEAPFAAAGLSAVGKIDAAFPRHDIKQLHALMGMTFCDHHTGQIPPGTGIDNGTHQGLSLPLCSLAKGIIVPEKCHLL